MPCPHATPDTSVRRRPQAPQNNPLAPRRRPQGIRRSRPAPGQETLLHPYPERRAADLEDRRRRRHPPPRRGAVPRKRLSCRNSPLGRCAPCGVASVFGQGRLDSRLRGNDGTSASAVIPAKLVLAKPVLAKAGSGGAGMIVLTAQTGTPSSVIPAKAGIHRLSPSAHVRASDASIATVLAVIPAEAGIHRLPPSAYA